MDKVGDTSLPQAPFKRVHLHVFNLPEVRVLVQLQLVPSLLKLRPDLHALVVQHGEL